MTSTRRVVSYGEDWVKIEGRTPVKLPSNGRMYFGRTNRFVRYVFVRFGCCTLLSSLSTRLLLGNLSASYHELLVHAMPGVGMVRNDCASVNATP